jgi:hypothetical protein
MFWLAGEYNLILLNEIPSVCTEDVGCVWLVPTLALPNIWQELTCHFFRQRILGPHLANYFARICEWEGGWASIGSQNFGYEPNNGKNLMGSQFFGGATMGTKPNTPVDYSDNLVPVPYTGVVSYITSKFLTSIFCTCIILIIYKG